MTQYILMFEHDVYDLERNNQWKKATNAVYQKWLENPMNLNCLLCAGTELWYAILLKHYFRNHPSPPQNIEFETEKNLQNRLMEVTRWGEKHFSDNAIFNAYFGYMIKVMPYFFLDYNGDYEGWQNKGIAMMRQSYELDHISPFTKAMRYEPDYSGRDTPYYDACRELWTDITPEQWGSSEVQQYFFRILMGDCFYPNAYKSLEE